MSVWNPTKAKVQLRLSVQRLRTLQQKKEAQAKAARRDIASLVEKGKLETARIKVESLVNEDVYVELLELLELYCELLLARFGLLDQHTREPDPGILEGVCSVIHAAPRTELKELHILRDILMHKYGREFSAAVMENRDGCVSPRIMNKLNLATPSPQLVNAYLGEIAKAYGVPWSDPERPEEEAHDQENEATPTDDKAAESLTETSESKKSVPETKEKTATATTPPPKETPKPDLPSVKKVSTEEDEYQALLQRFSDLKKR